MKGVQSWDCSEFHKDCQGVEPIDIGGFKYLWCPTHRVLANLDAIATKHINYQDAKTAESGLGVKKNV